MTNDITKKTNTVLIIEDEMDIRRLLKNKFVNGGINVLEAENGKVGLETALSHHPDVILLDILMPIMDGLVMLKELRSSEYGKDVPVIILTNLEKTKSVTESLGNDSRDYFMKSDLAPDDIANLINKKLQEHKDK